MKKVILFIGLLLMLSSAVSATTYCSSCVSIEFFLEGEGSNEACPKCGYDIGCPSSWAACSSEYMPARNQYIEICQEMIIGEGVTVSGIMEEIEGLTCVPSYPDGEEGSLWMAEIWSANEIVWKYAGTDPSYYTSDGETPLILCIKCEANRQDLGLSADGQFLSFCIECLHGVICKQIKEVPEFTVIGVLLAVVVVAGAVVYVKKKGGKK
ncbi:hypothetical protein KY316_01130 [Candidatus Woesearchaeota archaeon]|nr:hypothetical protein [Candidatus Woesearchaeota archaeon]